MTGSLFIGVMLFTTACAVPVDTNTEWNEFGIAQTIGKEGEDGVHNARFDAEGNLFLAGTTIGPDGSVDMALWKLDEQLHPVESFGRNGCVSMGSSGNDQGVDIAFMGKDEIWLLGQVEAGDRDFDAKGHHGNIDLAIVRLDHNGNLIENPHAVHLLGGSDDDEFIVHLHNFSEPGFRCARTEDGGLVVASMTRSVDGDWGDQSTLGNAFNRDILVFKLQSNGKLDSSFSRDGFIRISTEPGAQQKQQSAHDFVFSIQRNPSGGYLCAGYTVGSRISLSGLSGIPVPGNLDVVGNNDCSTRQIYCYKMDGLVFKFSEQGEPDLQFGNHGFQFFGGTRQEKFYNTAIDDRGNVLVVGRSSSNDLDVEREIAAPNHFDGVMVRLRADGTVDPGGLLTLSGPGNEQAIRVIAGDITWVMFHSDSIGMTDNASAPQPIESDSFVIALNRENKVVFKVRIRSANDEKPTFMLRRGDLLYIGGLTQSNADPQSRDIFLTSIPIGCSGADCFN